MAPPSHPTLRGPTSDRRCERESRRYAETIRGLHCPQNGQAAASSADIHLTAFAQLVALRLGAKRVLVSLFAEDSQYILAEATPTLSLQSDATFQNGDAMFFGTSILPRGDDWFNETLHVKPRNEDHGSSPLKESALVIPDLESDPRYCNNLYVIAEPRIRSYVGVPLLTPTGYPIGVLSVLDDKVRPQGVGDVEIKFMRDVATSIISHLELARIHAAHGRCTRLLCGLSRFISGKDMLDMDRGRDTFRRPARNTPLHESSLDPHDASREQAPYTPKQPHAESVSKDVAQAFERAAKLIQQAMDVEGVLFLDASTGYFRSVKSCSSRSSSSSSSCESVNSAATAESNNNKQTPTPGDAPSGTSFCICLALAYRNKSDNAVKNAHDGISQKFLRSLLRRFPRGRAYNFGEDGSLLLSDEELDCESKLEDSDSMHEGGERPHVSDLTKIAGIFPKARSFAVMPMWDAQRGRVVAGSIVWSDDPHRFFSAQDDLSYLGAFSDVVMAEVGRLGVQADTFTRTNFISSISHELRSPLHGILGSVEFLQEDRNDPESLQQMVRMIDTCGRTLLDIVNNLLEHAHASSAPAESKSPKRSRRHRVRRPPPTSSEPVQDLAVLAEEVLDLALWNTPQPQPVARTEASDQSASCLSTLSENDSIKVLLDIDTTGLPWSGWNFHVNPGAFRRILQNLTANAIKYTDRGGYYKLSLGLEEAKSESRTHTHVIQLRFTDTGRGMSELFIKHGLWEPFMQENPHASGTGLGLSMAHSLVLDMDGTIDIETTQGFGTSINIKLPLTSGSDRAECVLDSDEAKIVKGLTYDFIGFGASPDQDARAGQARDMLQTCVRKTCEYLGLETLRNSTRLGRRPDIYIVSERHALRATHALFSPRKDFQTRPCVVLCDSVAASRSAAVAVSNSMLRATFASQPLGPRQLLKALVACRQPPADATGPCTTQDEKIGPIRSLSEPSTATKMTRRAAIGHLPLAPGKKKEDTPGLHLHIQEQRPPAPSIRSSMSMQDSCVLLVDDNPVNLSLLRRYMKKLGRRQVSATNGKEALDVYEKSHAHGSRSGSVGTTTSPPVSIIFMDITMPVMDGFESTRNIRIYERSCGLKPSMVVALTALASPEAQRDAYSSGVDLFITKPVRLKDIEKIFEDWDMEPGGSTSA